jgi:AcrR family transcriptional regulator
MSDVKGPNQTRKAKAAATRQRIIAAAAEEFAGSGYHGTAMAAIAKRAGLAVQTVYFVFHTKGELFAAALDAAVLGQDGQPPEQRDWAQATAERNDPAAAIRAFIRGTGPILERVSPLAEVARAAAPTDPDASAIFQSREELRIRGYQDFMAMLTGSLPDHVDAARATDILITMDSAPLYLAFRRDRGWSHGQIIDWMMETIPDLMLRSVTPSAATDAGRPNIHERDAVAAGALGPELRQEIGDPALGGVPAPLEPAPPPPARAASPDPGGSCEINPIVPDE